MTPQPVICRPVFKAKPWGGRRLASLGKALPEGARVGESWELADLPGDETCVARGPLAGRSIRELLTAWGAGLLGGAAAADGRFPLLVKYLDAADHLSVQVHPRPPAEDPGGWSAGVKHECWYVLAADPGAELFIGLQAGIGPAELRAACADNRAVELLQRRPARPGLCYYLPSGTLHALGRGVLVAEVQTPSDVTYRLFDWDRRDARGQARELHVAQCLANVRYDVAEAEIMQAGLGAAGSGPSVAGRPLVRCARFWLDELSLGGAKSVQFGGELAVLLMIRGAAEVECGDLAFAVGQGETVLLPACCPVRLRGSGEATALLARVPRG